MFSLNIFLEKEKQIILSAVDAPSVTWKSEEKPGVTDKSKILSLICVATLFGCKQCIRQCRFSQMLRLDRASFF